jgi:hypothetical protein
MKGAIAIDRWKLPIFRRHLTAGGYTYTTTDGLTPDTMFLYVVTDRAQALAQTILAANQEAAKAKK